MNRLLAVGYIANVMILLSSILIARGAMPGLSHGAALAASQVALVLLLPAGLITRAGMVRSHGKLRTSLALFVIILDIILALGGLMALAFFFLVGARVVA